MQMTLKDWLALAAFIALAEGAGIIGSIFTAPAIGGWYAGLIKPELAPPDWVFGPVWTTLFLLMGIAAFMVWRYGYERREVKAALWIFVLQLILNVFWSIVFFGLESIGWAFAVIVALWLAIFATVIAFGRVSRGAAWLLVPYIAWVSFAAYLNYMFWSLNS